MQAADARPAQPLPESRNGSSLVAKTTPTSRMQRHIAPLYVMHTDCVLHDTLRRLPGHPYAVTPVSDWVGLSQVLRKAPPTAVTVLDPRAPEGGFAEQLRELLRAYPSATVLAAFPLENDADAALRALLSWGVADVIDLIRESTPASVARTLRLVRGRTVRRLLRRALPRGVPSRTRSLLVATAEVVSGGGQASDLARALGVDERTVPRWCARADLPPPRRLMAWIRLLIACDLLDDPGRSGESVARASGYAGASSLKTALRNFLGASPSDLRERGAFSTVASAFERELSQLREQARDEGKPEAAWLH